MRSIEKPNEDVEVVFDKCISNIRNQVYKKRLSNCTEIIKKDTEMYEAKILTSQVHTIASKSKISEYIFDDDMTKIYDNKFAKKGSPGRQYYDKIISIPHNGICPLCGVRIISTLDHYMPKSKFPTLAVSPTNLVPSCSDCNKAKGILTFTCSADETLNPYYDVIDNEKWLKANIKKDGIVYFYVIKPDNWSEITYRRLITHFKKFELDTLYSTHAAEELANKRTLYRNLYKKCGLEIVQELIAEEYESCRVYCQNSWRSALYEELKDSEQFIREWITNEP